MNVFIRQIIQPLSKNNVESVSGEYMESHRSNLPAATSSSTSSDHHPFIMLCVESSEKIRRNAEAVEEILEDDVEDAEKKRETTPKERRGETETTRETGGREGGEEEREGDEGEEEEGWEREEHLTIGDIMNRAIAEQAFPGGTVAFGSFEGPVFHASFGTYTYDCNRPITSDSLWDLASLTKIMATVPAAMILYEKGLLEAPVHRYLPAFGANGKHGASLIIYHHYLSPPPTPPPPLQSDLQAPVHRYLPAFGANGKHVVTVQMLLTHTAGLREFHPFFALQLSTCQQVRCFCKASNYIHCPLAGALFPFQV
ncbi:unnamed protein product [Closterium sp. NIES-54]